MPTVSAVRPEPSESENRGFIGRQRFAVLRPSLHRNGQILPGRLDLALGDVLIPAASSQWGIRRRTSCCHSCSRTSTLSRRWVRLRRDWRCFERDAGEIARPGTLEILDAVGLCRYVSASVVVRGFRLQGPELSMNRDAAARREFSNRGRFDGHRFSREIRRPGGRSTPRFEKKKFSG